MRRAASPVWALLPLALPVFSSSCAYLGAGSSLPDHTPARVEVVNNHWEDLTIFLERDGTLHRLGLVGGNDAALLRFRPEHLAGDGWIRLVAMETGRQVHTHSEMFRVQEGDRVVWRTGPQDHVSPVVIKP